MRTVIDLDDELLKKAAEELGTTTKKDTVHAALRAAIGRKAARNLRSMMTADPAGLEHEAVVNSMWGDSEQAQSA